MIQSIKHPLRSSHIWHACIPALNAQSHVVIKSKKSLNSIYMGKLPELLFLKVRYLTIQARYWAAFPSAPKGPLVYRGMAAKPTGGSCGRV